jgi:hypothetical protein
MVQHPPEHVAETLEHVASTRDLRIDFFRGLALSMDYKGTI